MNYYKAAIFDMDGTILDTIQDLWAAVNYALTTHKLPERSLEEVRRFIGNGVIKLIHRSVPTGTEETKEKEVFDTFLSYYNAHCLDHTTVFAGMRELLEEVKKAGIAIAVASNKNDREVKLLSERFFGDCFGASIGARDGVAKKPDRAIPDIALKELGCESMDKSRILYIGDSDVDLDTAKNACLQPVWVSWGYRHLEELKGYENFAICQSMEELKAYILRQE